MPIWTNLFKKSRVTAWAVFAAIVIASIIFTGWIFNLEALIKFGNMSLETMKLNTSLGILFSAASLVFYLAQFKKSLAVLFALIVFLIGTLTLSEYIFKLDLGIDELIVKDNFTPDSGYPGRMVPVTALIFILLGTSLLLYSAKSKFKIFTVSFFTALVLLFSFVAFIGYLFNTDRLYKIAGLTSISLETTFSFLFLSTAILFSRPESGFVAAYSRNTKSARIGGLHIILIIGLIITIGWLRLKGEELGFYDTKFGLTIMTISFILIFTILSWYFVRQLNIAEEKIKKSEDQYRSLFEQASDAIFINNKQGNLLDVNSVACDMLGFTREQLVKMKVSDLFTLNELSERPIMNKELLNGERTRIERNIRRADNSILRVDITANMLSDGRIMAIVRDISIQKKAEQQLKVSEDKYRQIVETAQEGIWMIDENNITTFVNEPMAQMLNYASEEMMGKHLFVFMNEDGKRIAEENIKRRKQGIMEQHDFAFQSKEGKTIWTLMETSPMFKDGKYKGSLAMVINITERKKAEQKLKESEEKFRTLVEQAGDGIFIVDSDANYLEANERAAILTGYSIDELKQMNARDIIPADELKSIPLKLKEISEGYPVFLERVIRKKDGSLIDVEISSKLMISGKVIAILRDITERKKAELEIKKVNERFELISKATNDAIWEWNLETNEVWGNEAHQQLYGLTLADKVPDDDEWKKRIHPDDKEQTIKIVSDALASNQTSFITEYRLYTENNGWINVFGSTYIERNKNGKAIRLLGNMTNITERKKAEDALAESENYLRTIVQAEPECVKLLNINCELLDMNPAGLAMIEADNLEQVKRKSVLGIVKKPYRDAFENLTQNVFKGKSGTLEFEIEGLKGTRRWLETHAVPLKNADGNIISLLSVTRDITEKKKADDLLKKSYRDIRRLATHLEQVREEERISIARDLHDELGQQLTVLKMDIAWIRKKIPKEEMFEQKITELLSTVDNTIKTVRRISTELRPSVLDDLGIVAALEWQSNEFEKRTGIETNLTSDIKELKLPDKIATGLFRIFQESLTNVARHADATSVNALLGIENGKLRMQIRDNGKGFDQQTIEVKKTLGILGMRERTKIMGGEYLIESMEGKGSVIEVKVPISSITSI